MAENGRRTTQTLMPSGFKIGAGKFWAGITTRNNRLFYFMVFVLVACFFLFFTTKDFPQYSWTIPAFIFCSGIFLCTILVLKPKLFDSEEHTEYMHELALQQGTRASGMVEASVIDQDLFSASVSPSKPLSTGQDTSKILEKKLAMQGKTKI